MLDIIAKVFILQAGAIVLTVFILKKILDRQLTEAAIHSVEALDKNLIDKDLAALSITTYELLSAAAQNRLLNALNKKINKTVRLDIVQDKKIKGGMIIRIQERLFDYSLHNRLKEGGFLK